MIEPRIRRKSATAEDLARRQESMESMTTTHNTEEDSRIIPPSALRYRPSQPSGNRYVIPLTDGTEIRVTERELEDLPEEYQTAAQLLSPRIAAPRQRRQPNPKRPVPSDTVYEMPPARTQNTDVPQKRRRRSRIHWLVPVGIGMLIMLIGWIALTALGAWWQGVQDDWHYGRPRTFQIDQDVGHGTTSNPASHFIVINLNKHIEIIEIPGGDASKARLYEGPTLFSPGSELTPVTLSFADVNHDGRLDMILHIGDSQLFIFLNQKDGTFKPANQ